MDWRLNLGTERQGATIDSILDMDRRTLNVDFALLDAVLHGEDGGELV